MTVVGTLPGHALWFDRAMFGAQEATHGDKPVWKLVDDHGPDAYVMSVPVAGPVPLDVDSWADHEAMLAEQS